MSISRKIAALITSSILCLVITLGIVAYMLILASGNESASKTLKISQKAMQANVDAALSSMSMAGDIVEENAPLALAVANNDARAARAIAKAFVDGPGIEFFTVCDMNGKVLARGHSDQAGDQIGMNRLTFRVPMKEGRRIAGLEAGNVVPLTLGAGVPLLLDGKQIGVVILGTNLSSATFVNSIKESLEVESTIFLDDVRVATTVHRDGKPVINTKLNNPAIYDAVLKRGEMVFTRNEIAGQAYDTAYWPWKDLNGNNAGIFFVGLSRAIIDGAQFKVVMFFLLAGIVTGLILIMVGVLFARALSRPLVQAKDYAEQVAGGDFSGSLDVRTKDEVGALSRSLGSMVENLKTKIAEADERSLEAASQAEKANAAMSEAQVAKEKAESGQQACLVAASDVEKVVEQLIGAANELDAQVVTATRSAESQREQVTSSAAAMEEMNATVLEVARNAAVAADGSANARAKAQAGARIVEDSVKAISVVREETRTLRAVMGDLGKEAEGIGDVMTVINDIADQTNLLALNAAIEAARAGEAGRGFAVVAAEVRKLAEKTMTATKEVGTVISSIQSGTLKSIESVDRTGTNLESATELATRSGQSLAEIVEESVATADQVHGIATAAEEQSATSEQITRSLEDINVNSTHTAEVMRQSAEAVKGLASLVRQLQDLVHKLRSFG